jgi:excisionase family DNA binding protein
MSNGDELLTVEETIQRLRIGRTTIHELVQRGELASIKIGRRRLFTETAIAAFIQRKLEEAARG